MKKYILTFSGLITSLLLLSAPFIVTAEGVAYEEQDKLFCEKSGGTWEKDVYCLDIEDVKVGMDQCQEEWQCSCDSGEEISEYGTCVEEPDFGMMADNKESCEDGGGFWKEDEVVEIDSEEDGEKAIEEFETESDDDDDITEEPVSDDIELGYCDCEDGMFWSSDNECVAFEVEYLCSSSGGDWDEDDELCSCWAEDATWSNTEGCAYPISSRDEEEISDVADNGETDVEDDTGLNIQPLMLIVIAGGPFLVGLFLGVVLSKGRKSQRPQMQSQSTTM